MAKRRTAGAKKQLYDEFGVDLLIEHDAANDPFVDDCPSARYYASRHRDSCKICKFIDAHPGAFNQMKNRKEAK